jgi:hypothetical protein
MMTVDDFARMGDFFFTFRYRPQNKEYLSGIVFEGNEPVKISDEKFVEHLPKINDSLEWISANADNIKSQIAEKLTNTDVEIFNNSEIISFSLVFELADNKIRTHLNYGNELGESFLIACIKDCKLCHFDVWNGVTSCYDKNYVGGSTNE